LGFKKFLAGAKAAPGGTTALLGPAVATAGNATRGDGALKGAVFDNAREMRNGKGRKRRQQGDAYNDHVQE